MYTQGRRNKFVVIAIIVLVSAITSMLFQNCGGHQSQASLGSSATPVVDENNNPNNVPNNIPTPPGPVPVPMGCMGARPADVDTVVSGCPNGQVGTGLISRVTHSCVNNQYVAAAPISINNCAPMSAPALTVADRQALCLPFIDQNSLAVVTSNGSTLTLGSGLGDGGTNMGNGDLNTSQLTATANPQILPGSQNISTVINGQVRNPATMSCTFETIISCEILNDGSSTVSKAINMDPISPNYGKDEVEIANAISDPVAKKAALDKILMNVFGSGMSNGATANTCAFTLADPINQRSRNWALNNVRTPVGYRCVQGSIRIRMSARTRAEGSNNLITRQATASADFSYVTVAVNNNCLDESKLIPNPTTLIASSNYGEAVAASDRWFIVLSPSDDERDGVGNLTKSQVGFLSVHDKNNLNLAPVRLYLPNIVGGGSLGDSTVSVALFGNQLAASRINRATGKGYVYYFINNGSWSLITTLQQPLGQDRQRFGHSLAFSSSGVLAVGAPRFVQNGSTAPGYGDLSGRVYLYNCSGSGCSPRGEIQNSSHPGSAFGTSLSISGNRLAIGAPYFAPITDDRGEGYVSVYDISGTPNLLKTVAAPGFNLVDPQVNNPGARGRAFGLTVSLYNNQLLVGAPNRSVSAANGIVSAKTGEAYFYSDFNSSTLVTLSRAGVAADSRFGQGVALNSKGAFVGCPYCQNNMGQVSYYAYNASNTITNSITRNIFPLDRINRDGFGNSVFATDNDIIVGASNRTWNSRQMAGAGYRYAAP
jgi:hypothetical protein